jgi:hypothetical protein
MECSICLDIIEKNTEIKTNCGHIFHKKCIIECIDYKINSEEYYDNKLECPNCRGNINEIDDNNIMEKLEKLNNKQITPNINILDIYPPVMNMYSILSRVVNNDYITPIRPRILSETFTPRPLQMRIINEIEYGSNIINNNYQYRLPSIYISRPPISRIIPGNMLIERRNYRLVTRYRNNNNKKTHKILKEIQDNYNTMNNIKMNKKKNKYNNKKNNKKFNNNYKYNNKSKNYKILR